MAVKTQAEIIAELNKSAQAMVQVQQIAEAESAALSETEPTPIETIRGTETGPGRFTRQP